MPSAVGYQPNLADEMGALQERITSVRGHSITSLQAIYVPADDYTDPALQRLSLTWMLQQSCLVKLPLVVYIRSDLPSSTSRILILVMGKEHYEVATLVKSILQKNKELQDIIAILGKNYLKKIRLLLLELVVLNSSCHRTLIWQLSLQVSKDQQFW